MIKLTNIHLDTFIKNVSHNVVRDIEKQIAGFEYKNDVESIIFEDDISDEILEDLKGKYDCTDYDDWDLIAWVRDLQHDAINDFVECISLSDYINHYFDGNQTNFSKHIGKAKQRVTEMLNAGYIVVNGSVYSKRFDLPELPDRAG